MDFVGQQQVKDLWDSFKQMPGHPTMQINKQNIDSLPFDSSPPLALTTHLCPSWYSFPPTQLSLDKITTNKTSNEHKNTHKTYDVCVCFI